MDRIRNFAALQDAAVVVLARLGDKAAFSELVKRHQSWVRNLLRRLSGNATLADDLAQQVFLAAWINLAKLQSAEAFPGWLRSLAVTCWLKHFRKKSPLDKAGEIDQFQLSAPTPPVGLRIDVDQALAMLSSAERLCVVLCYHEGLSHSVVADLSGFPLGTVKSHVLRGREKLQVYLSAYAGRSSSGEAIND